MKSGKGGGKNVLGSITIEEVRELMVELEAERAINRFHQDDIRRLHANVVSGLPIEALLRAIADRDASVRAINRNIAMLVRDVDQVPGKKPS